MGYYDNRPASRFRVRMKGWWRNSLNFSNGLLGSIGKFSFPFLKMVLYFAEPFGIFILLLAFALNFGVIEYVKGISSNEQDKHIAAKLDSIEQQLQALNARLDKQQNPDANTSSHDSSHAILVSTVSKNNKAALNDSIAKSIEETQGTYWELYILGSAFILIGNGFDRFLVYRKTAEDRLFDKEKALGKEYKWLKILYFLIIICFITMGYFLIRFLYLAVPQVKATESEATSAIFMVGFFVAIWAVLNYLYINQKRKRGIDRDVL